MGMITDRRQRATLKQVDDNERRAAIAKARCLIYEKNYAVDSSALGGMLKEHSLVPTSVSTTKSSPTPQ